MKLPLKITGGKMNNFAIAVMNLANETNVGSLIRTANAANIKEVVIVGRKKWNKGAATGAHSNIKVVKMRTSDEFVEYCKEHDYNIVSIEIGPDSKNIFDYKYPSNPMLVIGNEGTGVPQKILENSIDRIYILQYGSVDASERGFNHPIERLHNTIRERTKVMGGFHGCIESAYAIMKGLEINYNFNRRHMASGDKNPSEVAIPHLELGKNKWLDLIMLSKIF